MKKIIIIGARIDGQAGVVLDYLLSIKEIKIVGFLDNTPALKNKQIEGFPVLGSSDDITTKNFDTDYFHVAIGDNIARATIFDQLKEKKLNILTIIHPSSFVSSNAIIGEGCYIGPMVVINHGVIIGDVCIINSGAIIEHDNKIGKGVHIAPGAKTAGRVEVGDYAFVGIGSTILPDVKIGTGALVGGGSTVVKNVESQTTIIGYAAKKHIKNIYSDTEQK